MTEITALPSNTFGVELEVSQHVFSSTRSGLRERLYRELFREHGHSAHEVLSEGDSTGEFWDMKGDGSCGGEFASPALSWQHGADEIRTMANALLEERFSSGRDCGLHVHHHFPDLTAKQMRRMWLAWAAFEPVLFAMVEPSRAENNFCKWMLDSSEDYDDYDDFDPDMDESESRGGWNGAISGLTPATRFRRFVDMRGRYVSLNFTKWWYTGTVEVRMHHGTLDGELIMDWIMFTQLFLHSVMNDLSLKAMSEIHSQSLNDKFWTMHTMMSERVQIPEFEPLWTRMVERIKRYNPNVFTSLKLSTVEGSVNA